MVEEERRNSLGPASLRIFAVAVPHQNGVFRSNNSNMAVRRWDKQILAW